MADDNNITRLLRSLIEPIQARENILRTLYTARLLGTAVGAQLDQLGKLVDQQRNGMDDDTYTRYVRAKIAALKSDGLVEDILTVAQLVVFDVAATFKAINWGHASFAIRIGGVPLDVPLAKVLRDFVRKTTAGGVRGVIEWSPTLPPFAFADYPDARGWGHAGDLSVGGPMSAAFE